MRVTDLLDDILTATDIPANVEIRGLAANSRKVEPGFLFAALKGLRADGADFIAEAVERGAVAVLTRPEIDVAKRIGDRARARSIIKLTDRNPQKLLSLLAARFYGAQPKTIAAVTGTNGKTSVASFTRQLWTMLGHRAASLGTLGLVGPAGEEDLKLTTPEAVTLFETLKKLAGAKVDHLAMEASSHGLDQYRLDGVRLRAAAFTNLTQDHLDYHPTLADYLRAKLRLFGEILPPGGVAVLNADGLPQDVEVLCRARGHRIIAVGEAAPANGEHIKITHLEAAAHGQSLGILWKGSPTCIELPLVGAFQALNALTAAALVIGCGGDPAATFSALWRLDGVPGRLELIGRAELGAPVFVDYAHTPDAIANVLRALRSHTSGRLHIVFGAGGDRDKGKRPLMGRMAYELADAVIVTDDNPRGENAAAIRAAILAETPGGIEIADRRAAIEAAVASLATGDVLVVAGKGHETGQIVGDAILPFSDAEEIRRVLSREGGGA